MLVNNHRERHQFEIETEGETAVLVYRVHGKTLFLDHTEVPPAFEGRGIGGQLARAGLEYARANAMEVVPSCPFILSYLRRHPEYADVVAARYRNQLKPA